MFLECICDKKISTLNLDDFTNDNLEIFNIQQNKYAKEHKFYCASLIILSLIDLGIIEISE